VKGDESGEVRKGGRRTEEREREGEARCRSRFPLWREGTRSTAPGH